MEKPEGVAVVTGAAGGMGSATARELVAEGWNTLLLCDLDAGALEAVAAPLREQGASVEVLAANIVDQGFGDALLAALAGRPIAALVHTAGVSPGMASPEDIIRINLDASVRLVEVIRDRMAPGSAAVLYASNSAHMPMPEDIAKAFWAPLPEGGAMALAPLAPTPELAYPMSKIGVRALVKREAKSFGERGARLVSVSPGAIATRMTQLEGATSPIVAHMTSACAVGRIGRPEELAAVSVFLCSPKASYVSAVDWLVDGGQTAALGF